MIEYIAVIEDNDWEGEVWTTFLKREGNEPFLEKLRATIDEFEANFADEECGKLEVEDGITDEVEVKILLKRSKEGYFDEYTVCDRILNPDIIDDSSFGNFEESFYKRKYFR